MHGSESGQEQDDVVQWVDESNISLWRACTRVRNGDDKGMHTQSSSSCVRAKTMSGQRGRFRNGEVLGRAREIMEECRQSSKWRWATCQGRYQSLAHCTGPLALAVPDFQH